MPSERGALTEQQFSSGVPARDCVYVGDAERDVQAGIGAGMATVVARYGYIAETERPDQWSADAVVETPLGLLAWLGRREAARRAA